jgi:hypothetical protein
MTETMVVGPGTLIFGEVGSTEAFEAQVTSAIVEWEVDSEDDEPVLSGDTVPGDDTFTATISGSLFQDIKTTGITTWTWDHKGEVVPFTYVPNTVLDRAVTGECKILPLSVGGEVKKKAKSDFEFACVGEPSLGDAA